MKLKAVLFDMDGVLFDSMPLHARCWIEAARTEQLHITKHDVYRNEGRTGSDTIALFTRRQKGRDPLPGECERIYAEKCRLFEAMPEAPAMPGAAEVVRKARAAGLITGVVTGSGQDALLRRLEAAFPGCFPEERVVSSRHSLRGKPFPDPYILGLRRVGCLAAETIVVENAPLGVQAARAACIRTLAVNTGGLPEQLLLDAGADLVLPTMLELARRWDEII